MDKPSSYTLPTLRETLGGVLLKVRAQPGASRNKISGVYGDALKVAVQAPPEKGKANQAIARALASALGAKESQVTVHSGDASRDKWFRVEGLSMDEVKNSLMRLLK